MCKSMQDKAIKDWAVPPALDARKMKIPQETEQLCTHTSNEHNVFIGPSPCKLIPKTRGRVCSECGCDGVDMCVCACTVS